MNKILPILVVSIILGLVALAISHSYKPRLTEEEAIQVCIPTAFRGEASVDTCMARYGYHR